MSSDTPDADPDVTPDTAVDTAPDATPCAYTDYSEGEAVKGLPATGQGATGVEADVWDALYQIEDPEMPVSIVDLGLIYGLVVYDDGVAHVDMTLTYTGCPARNMLESNVERAVAGVDGVEEVDVQIVWSPGWSVEMVTEQGKADLREFGLSV